jgi:UDP:flavonoid glycosyltransferase YjiC (YdhE family)
VALILFVAELGGGFGHVRRLLPVARAAAQGGHRPVFVTANPDEVSALLADAGFEGRAAPTAVRRAPVLPGGAVATSFADVLGAVGFAERDYLRDITSAWDALLADLRPAAVVCELSPFLCLALHGSKVPLLVLGYGFILPPPHLARFPRLLQAASLYSETTLLEAVSHVCRARRQSPLPALPALLAGSDHAVTGLDVLDPYRGERRQPALGPPAIDVDGPATGATEDLFAYLLGDAPATSGILAALAASGLRGRAYIRRGTAAHRRALAGGDVVPLDGPEPIRHALSRARFVVHHGSMLLTEECLAAGRPQMIAPVYLEHLFTAGALGVLGVGRSVPAPSSSGDAGAVIAGMSADTALFARASAFAEAFWRTSAPASDLPRRLFERLALR